MAFDYTAINALIVKMETENLSVWAEKLKTCMDSGSTGSEILMCLNWNLNQFFTQNKSCSKELLNECIRLNSEISSLINNN